ncbi:MAG: protease complex subunit PrcB family protein [Granulosicoccaceae bacterium]
MNKKQTQTVELEQLAAKAQCGRMEQAPALQLISSKDTLADFLTNKQAFGQPSAKIPPVDFTTETLVVVQMGQRPSAGYSLELTQTQAEINESRLELPVVETPPDPDRMHASMLTDPCLLIKIKSKQFNEVSALGVAVAI